MRLLILACSGRKFEDQGKMPAVLRYDGNSYRVLRKAAREGCDLTEVVLWILSAKYGLIKAHTGIEFYEQRMTKDRVLELRTVVSGKLRNWLLSRSYSEIYVDVGELYWNTLKDGFDGLRGVEAVRAEGRIGERLRDLKDWLWDF